MSDERSQWSRVKQIFDSALAQPLHERADFVAAACSDDVGLRRDVESLLAAHADAAGFAERPAIDALAERDLSSQPNEIPALSPGFELGPYRIVQPLDAGGIRPRNR